MLCYLVTEIQASHMLCYLVMIQAPTCSSYRAMLCYYDSSLECPHAPTCCYLVIVMNHTFKLPHALVTELVMIQALLGSYDSHMLCYLVMIQAQALLPSYDSHSSVT